MSQTLTDLSGAKGLRTIQHKGPSLLDSETIAKSGHLPRGFLIGCGLNERAIGAVYADDTRTLALAIDNAGDYFSCFISYSSSDADFVKKLHEDLQGLGVRCWFAPEDMKIGAPILDSIFEAIRHREKLLLVLSRESVGSSWVKDEVEKAFAEERDRGDYVIFPIRIDETAMQSQEAWARKIRDTRHIGDFSEWRDQAAYESALARLSRDLKRPN